MAVPGFDTTVRIALDTLRANPLRTLLSTLGIVMGAASLAAVLSLGDGAERFARLRVEHEGLQTITIQPRTSDRLDDIVVPRTDYPTFTAADAEELAAHVTANVTVAIAVQGTGVGTVGQAPRGILVTALHAIHGSMPGIEVKQGRMFTEAEGRAGAAVIVVSDTLARLLAKDAASAIGAGLRVGSREWQVVGVARPFAGERQLRAVVPFAAAGAALTPAPAPRLPSLHATAPSVEQLPALRRAVDRWIGARGWTRSTDVQMRGAERLRQVAEGILLFKILMGAFTAISLVVGGIGIMNVLLASVAERTREIGIRKSIGASRRTIVAQFLSESVAISLAGSLVGVGVGLAGAAGVTAIMRAQTQALVYSAVTWQTAAVSMLAAVLVGLVFGTYPALRASRLSPLDAIQRD